MDDLAKVIVPLIFFVVWGVNQLLNRDGRPSPGPARGPGPGPRPGGLPPAPRPFDRTPAEGTPAPWQRESDRNPAPSRLSTRPGEEVLVIRPESNRSSWRRANRAKSQTSPSPPPSRPEPVRPAPLGGAVSQTISPHLELSGGLLATGLGVLTPTTIAPIPGLPAFDVALALRTPGRLREAFVLNEIFQPPLARRRGRRG